MTLKADPNFHLIQHEQVTLTSEGTFTVVDVYHRADELFAKKEAGFVRLKTNGSTSTKARWEDLTIPYKIGDFGRLLRDT